MKRNDPINESEFTWSMAWAAARDMRAEVTRHERRFGKRFEAGRKLVDDFEAMLRREMQKETKVRLAR